MLTSGNSQIGLVITDGALKTLKEESSYILDILGDVDINLTRTNKSGQVCHLFVWDWGLNDEEQLEFLQLSLHALLFTVTPHTNSDWKLLILGEEAGEMETDGQLQDDPFYLAYKYEISYKVEE